MMFIQVIVIGTLSVLLSTSLRFLFKWDPKPILGVYAKRRGKWYYVKYCATRLSLWWQKLNVPKLKFAKDSIGKENVALLIDKNLLNMDNPQLISRTKKDQVDSMFFSAQNQEGCCMVMHISRKLDRQCEIWLTIELPGIGYYQHPSHPATTVYNTAAGFAFKTDGLHFEQLVPMHRWRISYNGLMRKCRKTGADNESLDEFVHVRFVFIWEAYTDVAITEKDSDESALADAIARQPWDSKFYEVAIKQKNRKEYHQFGEMQGQIFIQGHECQTLNIRGMRRHIFGEHDPKTFHRSILHMIVLENGTSFCVGVVSYPDYLSHCTVGCFFEPCGKQHSISSASLCLPILGEYFNPPKCYLFEFNAGGKHFEVKIDLTQTSKLYSGENLVLQMSGCVEVNGSPGRCLAEYIYRCTDSQLPVVNAPEQYPLLSEPEISANDREMICIPFTKSACCSSSLVGGKGAQLGSLTTLSISNVKVPNGFCLSIKAYEIQLKENPVLKEEVEKLENIVLKNATGNVKDICEDVVSAFKQYAICSSVQKAIEQEMKVVFGDKQDETLLAVRSSAAGEDGTEMSAAGQMDTILGVKGFLQVFDAVVKCWASQYAYQAVEYRRQHGQPLRSVMGVVVQEMVLSEASGVLFTREPLTGDPAVMTINANYGLGETVVSGEAEPDTITLSRTWDDKLAILDKKVGEKKVQMHVLEDGGTEIKEVGLKDMAKCCLTDAMILHLGNLGVLMEKYFGDPRDIEWAVHGGCLYLLQARPITSFDTESDYELIHEFDSPLASDKEWLTTANVQEMMPSAVTPLGLDNFGRSINYVFHNLYNEQRLLKLGNNLNLWKFMSVCRNHLFINIFHMGMTGENHVAGNNHVYAEVSLFGETLDNYPEEQILEYTGKGSFFNRLFAGFNGYLGRYVAKKMTKRWENVLKTYKIDGDSVQELYENITLYHPDMYQCWFDTVGNTSSSAIWSLLIVTVLSKGKTEWTAEISSDVAMILSKCEDVLSAGVPASIREIARSISEIGKDDEFLKLDSQTAVEWLNSEESGKVKKQFADFLAQHGHRCVREAELRETSWRFEPTKLIPSIQAILKTKRFENELDRDVMSVADTIAKLKTPTTAKTRFILKWLIPWAREAVGKREWGKSISIEMMEAFKQAYWKLATLMVQESRLPDKDLLFFLTHDEIGKLIKTRSARLIARATRRRRIFPLQRDLQFPVLNTGHPIALDEGSESDDYFVTSVRLKGVPVSLGKIKGKARVVKSLKEAESIQYGEILIVSYTDVGWTPYFPLISGLVTEIGGLLSHGAVVAREYGLPCIVSCAKATYSFKSGDNVFLDATIGTIERIEEDVSRQQ